MDKHTHNIFMHNTHTHTPMEYSRIEARIYRRGTSTIGTRTIVAIVARVRWHSRQCGWWWDRIKQIEAKSEIHGVFCVWVNENTKCYTNSKPPLPAWMGFFCLSNFFCVCPRFALSLFCCRFSPASLCLFYSDDCFFFQFAILKTLFTWQINAHDRFQWGFRAT